MSLNTILIIITLPFLGMACAESRDEHLKEYYFPLESLEQSKVYKYECKANPANTQYWEVSYNQKDQIFTTKAFDNNFIQYELFVEKITNKGTEAIEFVTYLYSKKGISVPLQKKLRDIDVYKWDSNATYQYSAVATYDKNKKTLFSKKRKYIKKERVSILGKEYDAAKFKSEYLTEFMGSDEKYEYVQYSYYAKGIGLIKMIKTLPTKKIRLELTRIFTPEEWKDYKSQQKK